jgi:HPt (histidine-containing phosphotransfer) domain-containing protein
MPSSNYEFIDLSYLDQVAGDDNNTRSTLLELIARELTETIPQLSDLYAVQAWGDIKNHVHRMKTTLAFAGNAEMSTANSQIWKALVAMKTPEAIGPMIGALEANYRQVVQELRTELRLMTEA